MRCLQRVGANALAFEGFGKLVGEVRIRDAIEANDASISDEVGSTPNFLPSLIFTFSLISSSITSCRTGGLARGQEVQLAALLDIVIGDGLAVDHHGDGLRMQRRSASPSAAARRRNPG